MVNPGHGSSRARTATIPGAVCVNPPRTMLRSMRPGSIDIPPGEQKKQTTSLQTEVRGNAISVSGTGLLMHEGIGPISATVKGRVSEPAALRVSVAQRDEEQPGVGIAWDVHASYRTVDARLPGRRTSASDGYERRARDGRGLHRGDDRSELRQVPHRPPGRQRLDRRTDPPSTL